MRNPAPKTPHPVAITGITAGGLLVIVMLASLLITNRIPALERYAFERNAVSYLLFALVMLIPVCRFLNQPARLFGAALISWTLFSAGYDLTCQLFTNLAQGLHRTPFQVLFEGILLYGISAVAAWVVTMALHARRHPVGHAGHRAVRQIVPHDR
jgi:hypothetical protein